MGGKNIQRRSLTFKLEEQTTITKCRENEYFNTCFPNKQRKIHLCTVWIQVSLFNWTEISWIASQSHHNSNSQTHRTRLLVPGVMSPDRSCCKSPPYFTLCLQTSICLSQKLCSVPVDCPAIVIRKPVDCYLIGPLSSMATCATAKSRKVNEVSSCHGRFVQIIPF